MTTMKLDLRYLMRDLDRHGNLRLYVRKDGRKIRLREAQGTPAFARAYSEALDALNAPAPTPGPRKAPYGTLGWLAASYFASSEFGALDEKSRSTRRLILEDCLQEPRKPGSDDLMWACPVNRLSAAHIQMLRDRKSGLPGAANNRLKYLSAMFGWAIEARHMTANPARDVRPMKYATDGFYTWTDADVRQYEARHAIGTKARLALALLMFTGARRGDVVNFGKQHVRDGWLRFVPNKTRYKRKTISEKPVLPELARIIAKSPVGDLTFLVTEYGRAFTAAGFGSKFRHWCDQAGLRGCTAHGLRKAGAARAAEAGATDRQLMAIFDWSSSSQATTYTEKANRKRMTGDAMKLLAEDQTTNVDCPTTLPHQKIG